MLHQWAIIGFGGMGGYHQEQIKKRVPELTIKGGVDVRPEAYEKMRALGMHEYPTLQALLDDKSVDIVTIATPNDFHKDISIACLKAGKNVVCEKPVTLNAAELEEIIAVAKETGKLFSVHQNRRWDKDYRIMREVVKSDVIGTPYYIESRVLGSRRSLEGWRGHKPNGGGMIYDWGIHLFDQLLDYEKSPVVSVDCHAMHVHHQEVDDNFKAFLRFESGLSAVIEIATNCFINLPRWHVCAPGGTMAVDDWECNGKIVKLNSEEKMAWDEDIVYTAAGPTRTMAPRPKQTVTELPLPEVHTDWAEYYRNIVAVLDDGAELIVKPEEALRVMRLVDALFESARLGVGIRTSI